jgi:hypothetical protein
MKDKVSYRKIFKLALSFIVVALFLLKCSEMIFASNQGIDIQEFNTSTINLSENNYCT